MYLLLCLEQITNKDLLYSTGNSAQCHLAPWMGEGFGGECMHAKSLQLCPTLCDPMDCSPPGSSVHGIPQARILEWVAIPFSRQRMDTCICMA